MSGESAIPAGKPVLITGGAGFIGTNVAESYLAEGRNVHILDNLSRAGVEQNLYYLRTKFSGLLRFTHADVRDRDAVSTAIQDSGAVIHLAAQVAVTTSLDQPIEDLEVNLLGTVNILEAIRRSGRRIPLLFTSTNKVYGKLLAISLRKRNNRWEPADEAIAEHGIAEEQALDFLSPYGCSKGSADQYVLDYARSYDLSATVFRMSCIYGPHQLGCEDQGWVAHFVRQALRLNTITVYGDGLQVRDLLFVDDLVSAIRGALEHIELSRGRAFNLGGGPANSASLLDVIRRIDHLLQQRTPIDWGEERLGDQKWYVADTRKIRQLLNWHPQVNIESGLNKLVSWYQERPTFVRRAAVQVA